MVDVLHVSLSEKVSGKTVLAVYDQQGRLVQATTVFKNTSMLVQILNVNNLAAGSYVLKISNEYEQSSLKFIIAR